LGAFAILIINSYRKLLLSRLIMTFIASALFSTSAILFRNGGEYYLIVNLVISIMYFKEKKFIITITLLNCILFLAIKIFLANTPLSMGEVPFARIIFNIGWALICMLTALLYFKYEQLTYQTQVEEKNRELEKLNDTKQKLFSIIAHDLRSPIGQLKSSLDLVNQEYLTPEQFRHIAATLSSEVDQLHTTLDNLLRWSINQFQGIQTNPEKTSLAEIIEQKAVPLLKQSIERKNIQLKTEGLNRSVWADPDHLMLVFRNLIANAIKYSYQDGIITIQASQRNGQVIIAVADNGTGMTEEIRSTLFHSLAVSSVSGTSNEKGTGLGLKLCKEFIEQNKGQIWVESEPGKGSRFYISLPSAK